jgi:glycosyltransferase involved in cell wall biosynthesis
MRRMELTVCVCVRDGADYVDRCLKALVSETAALEAGILVVDHASTDGTPEILARWASEHPARLRVLRFTGEGLAAVRDFAWRHTDGAWVGFVDVDCEVQPGWGSAVREAMRAHASDPRCGGFGGSNRVPLDGSPLYRAYAVLLATYVGGHDSILNRRLEEHRRVEHCPTLNVVYRRSALERAGGFDPAYTRLGEDLEMSRRLVQAGYALWAHPDMTVEHALRPTLRSWLRNMYQYGRGRCFHLKRHPAELHPKFLAPLVVVLAYGVALLWGIHSGTLPRSLGIVVGLHVGAIGVLLAGEALRQRAGLRTWIAATAIVWLTHLTYGTGLLAELPRRRDRFVV